MSFLGLCSSFFLIVIFRLSRTLYFVFLLLELIYKSIYVVSASSSLSREMAIADVYRRVSLAVQRAQSMAILTLGELAGVLV